MGWTKIYNPKHGFRPIEGVRVASAAMMKGNGFLTRLYIGTAVTNALKWDISTVLHVSLGDGAEAGLIRVEPASDHRGAYKLSKINKSQRSLRVQFGIPGRPTKTFAGEDVAHWIEKDALVVKLPKAWDDAVAAEPKPKAKEPDKVQQVERKIAARPREPEDTKPDSRVIRTPDPEAPHLNRFISQAPKESQPTIKAIAERIAKQEIEKPGASKVVSSPPPPSTEPPPSWRGTGAKREDDRKCPMVVSGRWIFIYPANERVRELHKANVTKQTGFLLERLVQAWPLPITVQTATSYIASKTASSAKQIGNELQFYIDDANLQLTGYAQVKDLDDKGDACLLLKFAPKIAVAA